MATADPASARWLRVDWLSRNLRLPGSLVVASAVIIAAVPLRAITTARGRLLRGALE
jgi:hypothetical protein